MLIKTLTYLITGTGQIAPFSVIEVDEKTAKSWLSVGYAEEVKPTKPPENKMLDPVKEVKDNASSDKPKRNRTKKVPTP